MSEKKITEMTQKLGLEKNLTIGCTKFTVKGVNASSVCLCETDMCNDQICKAEKVIVRRFRMKYRCGDNFIFIFLETFFFAGHKSTLAVPVKIHKCNGSSWNYSLTKTYLTWPYLTNLASPLPTLPGATYPCPDGGHLNPVFNADTHCQIIYFKSYQNLM